MTTAVVMAPVSTYRDLAMATSVTSSVMVPSCADVPSRAASSIGRSGRRNTSPWICARER